MQVVASYSHLGGKEFLQVRRGQIWDEIASSVVESVDPASCSQKSRRGDTKYRARLLNESMSAGFVGHGWDKHSRLKFSVTSNERVLRSIVELPQREQQKTIDDAELRRIDSYYESDFTKDRTAVEVQFGPIDSISHDIFVKHPFQFLSGMIDVGVEIVPMKELQASMSASEGYYEVSLFNILRHGRNVPAVPLVLIGVAP
jgi:hypothetical protein